MKHASPKVKALVEKVSEKPARSRRASLSPDKDSQLEKSGAFFITLFSLFKHLFIDSAVSGLTYGTWDLL